MTKKVSKGFTLAEVLITLGIIGIVAALTMPQLFNRTKNAHLGAQLANAVATIENASGIYLYDHNVKKFSLAGKTKASDVLDALKDGYIKMNTTTLGGFTTCTAKYALPDKTIIGVCTDSVSSTLPADATGSNLFVMSSTSVKNKAFIEGLDYFRMYLADDGRIYLPGLDYISTATCDKEGGEGCTGYVAKHGWKVDY